MAKLDRIRIPFLDADDRSAELCIYANGANEVYEINGEEAKEYGESPFQIIEGCTYEYTLNNGYCLTGDNGVVRASKATSNGWIQPNIQVGTLHLLIRKADACEWEHRIAIEVRSIKAEYRSDYRFMLNEIAEKCTDLLMRHSSSVTQLFDIHHQKDSETAYQRFAFLKSILDTEEFRAAIHKVQQSPVTKWREVEVEKDIRSIKKIGSKALRRFASAKNRIQLPEEHPLRTDKIIDSVPARLSAGIKHETVDTAENRFIKYALESFLLLCSYIKNQAKENQRLNLEAKQAESQLELYLEHSLFKEVGRVQTLPLNSPVLQRKEGYREILKTWLISELAAKLSWKGGEDVYAGGKRDVASLYEYWLFFRLLETIHRVFRIEPTSVENLIEPTKDRLGLKLKQGNRSQQEPMPIKGIYDSGARKLNVEFAYNRTFGRDTVITKSGSWTNSLRPDYTLSIWPCGIEANEAEEQELIVHIHFDAKYKIENFLVMLGKSEDSTSHEASNEDGLAAIEKEERQGFYKRADLLKMHTYRDAIRRTAGAYVLYPGSENVEKSGFHEIVPGLGAFAINPSKSGAGARALEDFLNKVLDHLLNRASQRERFAYYNYEIHKNPNEWDVREPLPETFGENRGLLPLETYVVVGYYRGKQHLDWIIANGKYNCRADSDEGLLQLGPRETSARYLLLYNSEDSLEAKLFSLKVGKIGIMSKEGLKDLGYPTPPTQPRYIIYEIEQSADNILGSSLDFTKLGSKPFAVFVKSLAELLQMLKPS